MSEPDVVAGRAERAGRRPARAKRPVPQARRGCPLSDLRDRLRRAGLRPTRQRLSLGWLLFGRGDRHLTAEMLYDEAMRAKVPVSLATVYNTLHQFTEAGLLRQLAVDGSKAYFDTNPSEHHHFFLEEEGAGDRHARLRHHRRFAARRPRGHGDRRRRGHRAPAPRTACARPDRYRET